MDFLGNMQRRDSSTNEEDDGDVKKEAASDHCPDSGMSFKRETIPADEMEADNDALMQEFQNMATPQALRRLSQSISLASAAAEERSMPQQASPSPSTSGFGFGQGLGQGLGHGLGLGMGMNMGTAVAAAAASVCQCAKRVDEQVNFLEGLKREEQQLMQSTSQDLARCKNVLHVGDSDYNYLISFMPLMKQMTPIQNVFFRAKMGELLLQTMHQQPPVQLQQQQRQQQQPQQQHQQEESQPSQMLLNQQQMALDQAELQ
ncbi:Hypothetical predicted protein [Drosophila guanche]|nr:Hypothetical predicted protein [Drosophila guanche]